MRCYICDKILTSSEIIFDEETKKFDPCGKCKSQSYIDDMDYSTFHEEISDVNNDE